MNVNELSNEQQEKLRTVLAYQHDCFEELAGDMQILGEGYESTSGKTSNAFIGGVLQSMAQTLRDISRDLKGTLSDYGLDYCDDRD